MNCKVVVSDGHNTSTFFVDKGTNLQKAILKNGFLISSPCGGRGTCGNCKAVVSGEVSDITDTEKRKLLKTELSSGIRLTCQVTVLGDTAVHIEQEKSANIQIEGLEYNVELSPLARRVNISLSAASLENSKDDARRILQSLGEEKLKFLPEVYSKVSNVVNGEKQDLVITCTDETIIDVNVNTVEASDYGFAVDIGTTTIVGYLVDLYTGKIEETISEINDQSYYGADVLSRISYGRENPHGNDILHAKLTSQISRMLKKIIEKKGISRDDVCCISLAGNTIMMHFLMGLNPFRISVSPFTPVTTDSLICFAEDLGIDYHPKCPVYLLPSISGYVGADITAGMLACSLTDKDKIQLMVDIGTNGEMVLSKNGELLCCSVAAGPAFEGAKIRCGVGGIEGAIDKISFEDGKFKVHTLWNKKPIGICGSGLIDAISVLVENYIVDETGRFTEPDEWKPEAQCLKDRLITVNGEKAFNIVDDIYICQQDVREVQLAKAAIYAGIITLLKHQNVDYDEVDIVWLAGGFGNKLNKESAVSIGMLPKKLLTKIRSAGNTSGIGAVMSLLSKECRRRCDTIKSRAKYLELSALPGFNDTFIEAMVFEE